MRVARPLLALIALAIAVAGCARQPMMGVQMAAAPAPYGIDNVVYGSAPAAYGAVAASPYRTMAPPAYAARTGLCECRRADLCNGSCAVLRGRTAWLRSGLWDGRRVTLRRLRNDRIVRHGRRLSRDGCGFACRL